LPISVDNDNIYTTPFNIIDGTWGHSVEHMINVR